MKNEKRHKNTQKRIVCSVIDIKDVIWIKTLKSLPKRALRESVKRIIFGDLAARTKRAKLSGERSISEDERLRAYHYFRLDASVLPSFDKSYKPT